VDLAEKCKAVDPEKYHHVWLGHFAMHREGLIYKGWKETTDEYWPNSLPCWYGVDWGFANDPAAVVRIAFDPDTHTVWLRELLYETGLLTADVARVIRYDIFNRKRTHTVGKKVLEWQNNVLRYGDTVIDRTDINKSLVDAGFVGWEVDDIREWVGSIEMLDGEIYCDPARPEQISEMKINHGLWAMAAVNTDKTGRIEYFKYFDVRYIGDNIDHEVRNYRWQTSKTDKTQYINKPQDGGDHLMDATSYGAVTHLRRLGIANKLGEQ
jgi:phage terminase large subunit